MAVSIVDYLKKQGKDSSYAARKQLAAQNGIQDYRGTAAQNMNLLSMLQKGNTPPAAESNTGGVSANVTAGTGAGNSPSPSGGKVSITGKQTLTGNSEEDFRKSQSTQDYYDRLHAAEGKRPGPYEESDRVNDYMDRLDELEGNKPGKFESKYEDKINSLVDQILNGEKFEYTSEDLANDSLYQLYRENFMRQGNQAMRDTMGAAAGLTGGYGSTYAAAAGQQAFDNKLAGLNDMALEFADRAYAKYLDEIKNKYNQMDITGTPWQIIITISSTWRAAWTRRETGIMGSIGIRLRIITTISSIWPAVMIRSMGKTGKVISQTWRPKSGRNSLDSSSPRRRRTRPDGKRKWHSRESSLSSRRRRRRKKDLVEVVDLEERHQRKRHPQREDMHRLPRN